MSTFEALCRAHANFAGIIFPSRTELDGIATTDSPFSASGSAEKSAPSSRGQISGDNWTTAFNGASGVSVVCYYKPTSADLSGNNFLLEALQGADNMIFSRTNGTGWRVGGESTAADAGPGNTISSVFTAGVWYFLAFYLDFSGDLIGQKIDGGSITTTAATFGSNTWTLSGLGPVAVGMRSGSSLNSITGRIFAMAFFDAVLTNTEFEALRAATHGESSDFVGTNTASITLDVVDTAGDPRASQTGIGWTVLDSPVPGTAAYVVASGVGETTNGGGQLVISIPNTRLDNGDIVTLALSNTGGTPGAAAQQWVGPVSVAV